MPYLLSILAFLLLSLNAFGSEWLKCSEHRSPLICKNKQGKVVSALNPSSNGSSTLTGEIFSYADDAEKQLMRWQSYQDGKMTGMKYYFDDGSLEKEYQYKQGKKEGTSKEYNSKKRLLRKESWSDDRLNGPFEYFDQFTGEVKRKGNHKDGYESGFITEFVQNHKQQVFCYQNGNLMNDWSLCDSKYKDKQREEIQYYSDGSLKSKRGYINDKLNGPYIFYELNGKVSEQGQYKNGEPIGDWIWNDRQGVKTKAVNYRSPTDFTEKKFFVSGQISSETVKSAGKLVSLIEYFMNGKKKSELLFERPQEAANYKEYDDQGRLVKEGKKLAIKNDRYRTDEVFMGFDGLVKSYDFEKNIRTECEMKEDQNFGWCRAYELKSGTLHSEKKFEKYRMTAEKIYENGKLKSSKEFFEDGSEKITEKK